MHPAPAALVHPWTAQDAGSDGGAHDGARDQGRRLIDPGSSLDAVKDLYIDSTGFVAGVGNKPDGFEATRTIEARGRIVCPGLIDLRARLREPGLEHKATIESETRAAVAGGITTLCCPRDTDPPIDTPAMAQMMRRRSRPD